MPSVSLSVLRLRHLQKAHLILTTMLTAEPIAKMHSLIIAFVLIVLMRYYCLSTIHLLVGPILLHDLVRVLRDCEQYVHVVNPILCSQLFMFILVHL